MMHRIYSKIKGIGFYFFNACGNSIDVSVTSGSNGSFPEQFLSLPMAYRDGDCYFESEEIDRLLFSTGAELEFEK